MSEGAITDPNKHVKAFLAYYAALPQAPRYAVMLNGAWGIGKTFLLKAFLDNVRTHDFQAVHVSLNGLKSSEDIERLLFRAMYPLLDNKAVNAIGKALAGVGKIFKAETSLRPIDFFNPYTADLYVFDDIERCAMPIDQTLGYINSFVEHGDRKVILVANEPEIKSAVEYLKIREKLIGRTLEIQADFGSGLCAFIKTINDPLTRQFLIAKSDVIGSIYKQSGLNNLRILQQTMWDFERFYEAAETKHQANDVAMMAILRMFFALSFEFKAGNIGAADLVNRSSTLMRSLMPSQSKTPLSPLQKARRRYLNADLGSSALSDETLTALLVKGIVDGERIRADLNASSYFVTVADEPEWRTVAYAHSRTEAEFDAALERMEAAFGDRVYEKVGVILHVFGQRLWLTKIGVLPGSVQDRVSESKDYLDDLVAAKRLEPSSRDIMRGHLHSFEGIGIVETETLEFAELLAFLNEKRRRGDIDRYPSLANDLIEVMVNEPDQFFELIVTVPGKKNEVAYLPVFATFDPDVFVDRFLTLHPTHQREVLGAFEARYDRGAIRGDLAEEAPWIRGVREKIFEATQTMSPFGRERMRTLLKGSIDGVLNAPTNDEHGLSFVEPDFDE